jgi:hypothetical protein
MLALMQIGSQNSGQGPDLFHVEVSPDPNASPPLHKYLNLMQAALGRKWRGKMVVSMRKNWSAAYAAVASDYSRFKKPWMYSWMDKHRDEYSYEPADESSLAAAAIHETRRVGNTEGLPPLRWSQHYHRKCEHGQMHVCSPVCDAAVQQLLNIAFYRPRRDLRKWTRKLPAATRNVSFLGPESRVPDVSSPSTRFCLRCPASLIPFTITIPEAHNMICHDVLPASRHG